MKTVFQIINMDEPLEPQVREAAGILRRGGLVAFPTETVYGLGGNGLDAGASTAIYAAKGRPSDNPLILHIAEPTDAEKYAKTNSLYYALARRFMPGPLTLILPKRDCVPYETTGGLDSVALRCPVHPVARALIAAAGVAVAAPSANLSGKPSPTCASHVLADMDGRIDFILDGGECDIGVESTIVKLSDGKATMLRPGAITLEMLREIVPDAEMDPTVTQKPSADLRPQAPGMKYRHYAPSAPVVLLIDDKTPDFDSRALAFLKEKQAEDEKTGFLCFDEYVPELPGPFTLSLGVKADEAAHAHRLFAALRTFDSLGVTRIFATVAGVDGAGLAFFNRMLKASGYSFANL